MTTAGEPVYLPKPAATLTARIGDIHRHYLDVRRELDPRRALRQAISNALTHDEAHEVFAWFEGRLDHIYRRGDGAVCEASLQSNCEQYFIAVQRLPGHQTRPESWPSPTPPTPTPPPRGGVSDQKSPIGVALAIGVVAGWIATAITDSDAAFWIVAILVSYFAFSVMHESGS